ncbi:MAG: hypothetical protein ACFHX7_12600 [Pseudomonadota bacterium]
MSDFNTLKTVGLTHVDDIQQPLADTLEVSLNSSAREVFTDFTLDRPG